MRISSGALTLCIVLLVSFGQALPTTFDLRVQPSITKYANYALSQEGTCVAHAWGLQLAQIVSNAMSLKMKEKLRLSSQHILECISSKNEICHDASLENIESAMKFIEVQGITTEECIPNRLLYVPRDYCPRKCEDGYRFPITVRAKFTKQDNFNDMLSLLSETEASAALVIVKVSN
jgi:hypothetical protein